MIVLTVELQRVGRSSVSNAGIPICARILQDGKYGEPVLQGGISDKQYAKEVIQADLSQKFCSAVRITWIDKTGDA